MTLRFLITVNSARAFSRASSRSVSHGEVYEVVSYNSSLKCTELPETTAALSDLIIRSSLPLRSVETSFAVDPSGFATSRYVKWLMKNRASIAKKRNGSSATWLVA
jgi:hypothetical protein